MTYIFDPKDYSTGELWELVLQREELENAGVIGDCLLRELADNSPDGSPLIMIMEVIGYRSAVEILRRQYPGKFGIQK